jgi:hypothetical protein
VFEVYYVLDEQGDPQRVTDPTAWARWCEQSDRGVDRTTVAEDIVVLTTFDGVDEVTPGQQPLLFESRVFGGVLDGEEIRYATRADAIAGHESLVTWCRIGHSPDHGITEDQIT